MKPDNISYGIIAIGIGILGLTSIKSLWGTSIGLGVGLIIIGLTESEK